jgi:sulfur-carrier protein
MSNPNITICIKLFAAYQEAYGVPEIKLQLPENTPVQAVCDRMIAEHPELAKWRDVTRYGVNLLFVESNTPLRDGDEVVLIPPVSGG